MSDDVTIAGSFILSSINNTLGARYVFGRSAVEAVPVTYTTAAVHDARIAPES